MAASTMYIGSFWVLLGVLEIYVCFTKIPWIWGFNACISNYFPSLAAHVLSFTTHIIALPLVTSLIVAHSSCMVTVLFVKLHILSDYLITLLLKVYMIRDFVLFWGLFSQITVFFFGNVHILTTKQYPQMHDYFWTCLGPYLLKS